MKYINGKDAKRGDLVMSLETGQTGLVHSLNESRDVHNARICTITAIDPTITVAQCIPVEDLAAAAPLNPEVPNS